MKKIFILLVLFIITPLVTHSQVHAQKPNKQSQYLPGLYPEASKRILKANDLKGLNSFDLKVMRNEIYARHGYIFKTQEMKDYFNEQDWYNGKYKNVDKFLTETERKTLNL
ncbi:YARHG domain-containing protein [Paenimyroides tangerinum]|uniref:YARHG domain-containing protein n=1 Tax=Paenimyroides tangerinum TaxID=2488728 RepID=A0A3P3W912_9FLAO|nr:YARHG domain-containing protein [Paenimyroides tangerinum]RRJ90099.1 YARHG domain-containing protein [Paenimyroides tangerinum]